MSNIHSLYPQNVYLDADNHRYFDGDDKEYMSFSRLYNFLAPKFDSNFMAGKVAQSQYVSKESILNKWQSQTDEGTRLDAALELYAQTGQILESDADLEYIIIHVLEKYKQYHSCHEQLVVYNKETRTAGSLDKLALLSNRKDSKFHLSDFKLFENGMTYVPKGQAWLNYPFQYLPNTRYTKINVQTSYYAFHFELLTGRKCERIFVDMIRPVIVDNKVTGYKNEVIPMPYLRHQIEVLLTTFKDRIIKELEPVKLEELEEF